MKRAEVNAFCGTRETLYQRIVFFAVPAILLAGVVFIAVRYASLPTEIPTHYNALGEIDGYGNRKVLWLLPVIGVVSDAMILALSSYPQLWNVGIRVTVLNRARVYTFIRDLIADLRLSLAVLFTGMSVWLVTLPARFRWWTGVFIGLCCVLPVVRYFVRLRRV